MYGISWFRHMEEGSGGWYSEVSVYLAVTNHEIGNFASYVAFLFSNIPVSLSAYCIFSIYLSISLVSAGWGWYSVLLQVTGKVFVC